MAATDDYPVCLESWQSIKVLRSYSPEEIARMKVGFQPMDMDDRWGIAMESGLLVFRRSWTGFPIYAVSITEDGGRPLITEAWVTRNRDQYNASANDDEAQLLECLIEGHLLVPRIRH